MSWALPRQILSGGCLGLLNDIRIADSANPVTRNCPEMFGNRQTGCLSAIQLPDAAPHDSGLFGIVR